MKRKAADAGLPERLACEPVQGQGAGPFAVYFPAGTDPNAGGGLRWEAQASVQQRNTYVLTAKSADDVVNYHGSSSNPEYAGALPCKFALALVNKRTGKMQLMPAEGGKVFRLEPKVTALSYQPRGEASSVADEQRRAANMRLVEQFGSQRRQRQLRAREAGQVRSEHVSGAAAVLGLISDAGAGAGASKEEVIAASLAQRNIPPHHAEATTADDAYRESEIVPAAVSSALDITKLFPAENKPEYREQLRSTGHFGAGYVLSRLPVLAAARDKGQREARARMLAWMGHLLKLQAKWGVLKAREGEGLEQMSAKTRTPESVLEGALGLFYTEEEGFEGRKWVLSKDKRALMLAFIMVLAVRAEPGCVLEAENLQALADELKMRPADLAGRFKELGCVVQSVSGVVDAEGKKTRSHKVLLMPASTEQKTLGDYFPALKLGGRKR